MKTSANFRRNLKSVLLVACVIGLWGSLSACSDPEKNKDLGIDHQKYLSFIGVGESPNSAAQTSRAQKLNHRRDAGTLSAGADRPFAGSSTPTNTEIAPFFGNLTVVTQPPTAPIDSYNVLWRQPNCSLTNANYQISFNASQTGFVITPTQFLSGYEKTLHANAFLTSTPDLFPNGCVDNSLGVESILLAVAGPYQPGTDMLATVGPSGVITGSIDGYTSYAGPTPITTQYPPTAVVSGDLNKDGYPDVVSVNTDGLHASLTVFLGHADGTFTAGVTLALPGNAANYAAIDDMDGDGNLDIVSVSPNATETFSVFRGNGDGTFKPIQNVSIPGSILSFSNAFITTDMNHDGHKDIVATDGEVFLGKGDGVTYTLVPPQFANMSGGSSIVAADFNNDGKMDIVTDDQTLIRTYHGNGDGTLTAGPAYPTISDMGFIHATDLDGDGNMDIWSGYAGDVIYMGSQVTTGYALMGNGDGTFQGAPNLPFYYNGENMADLNGDGRPDFVGVVLSGSTATETIQTYLTGANGIPVAGPTQAVANVNGVDSLAIGDLTGDKIPDLFYVSSAPQIQSFYMAIGKGDGSFHTPTATPTPSLVPSGIDINEAITGIRLADMNHDGKLDLVYSFSDEDPTKYYQGFAVQLGNGDGTFKAPQIVYTYQSATNPGVSENLLNAIVDVTGDNFPDVFMVLPGPLVNGTQQAIVEDFVGKGDGTFNAPNTLTVTPNVRSAEDSINEGVHIGSPFAFGDVNGDGKIDMITSGSSADGTIPQIAITLGNGDGTFKAPTTIVLGGFGFADSPALADFDGDGKLDLANSVGVFPGNGNGTFQTYDFGDGTSTAPLTIYPNVFGQAGIADLNADGKPDLVIGSGILLSKFGAVPPVLAGTTTSLTSSLNPSTVGAIVTFTATVISATAGTITGTVTFYDGASSIGTGALNGSGMATLQTTALAQGSHTITAQYGGDTVYGGSASPVVTQVVNASGGTGATSTSVTSSLNPSTVGTSVTFTATVVATAPSGNKPAQATAATPTGTVTFKDGSTTLGPGTLSAGVATFATSALAQGTHSITAVYGGDTNYSGSTSTAVSQVVNAATGHASTTTAIASSMNPSVYAVAVNFTATVTSTTAGTIGGTVTFYNGSSNLITANVGPGGVATITTTAFTVGANGMTAHYSGDTNYAASTSAVLTQNVTIAPSTTTLSASPTSGAAGTNVTFSGGVTTTGAGKVVGTVNILDGATNIGSATLANGMYSFSTTTLAGGAHTITAVYAGNVDYMTSTSSAVTVTIAGGTGTFTVAASPTSLTVPAGGGSATTMVTVTPSGGFNQPVTLSCGSLTPAYSCFFSPAMVTPNGTTPATAILKVTYLQGALDARTPKQGAMLPGATGGGGGGSSAGGFAALARVRAIGFALAGEMLMLGLIVSRRRKLLADGAARVAYAVLAGAIVITAMAGCSGGSSSPVSTTITVNATAGATTVSTPVTVTTN